jgi:hypothetical protein
MSISRLRVSVLLFVAVAGIGTAVAEPNVSVARLRAVSDALNVVSVKVNGAGPFEFVLDTGSTSTTIDSELAARLRLVSTGSATSVSPWKSSAIPIVRADRLEVEKATVRDLDLSVERLDWLKSICPTAKGILGEDFLRNFDLLLDNRHHQLQMERVPGSLAEELTGERVPLTGHASHRPQLFPNRLILVIQVPELGPRELSVLLDSAANALMLFRSALQESQSSTEKGGREAVFDGGNRHQVFQHPTTALLVKGTVLRNVAVVSTEASEATDSDGLLPTGIFESIYISHSGGFAIFNPRKSSRSSTRARG